MLFRSGDGNYEWIFPQLGTIFGGEIDYEFAIVMLKYKGEIEVLQNGKIGFSGPEKSEGIPLTEVAILGGGFGLVFMILRWFRMLVLK